MLKSLLNLINKVQVRTITETSDGMGGLTVSTSLTTLSRANIWQASTNDPRISDKITQVSTHILACLPERTWTDNDREVLYNGHTYKVTGHADNVAERDTLVIVGLEWLT
jgi:hypothetical protein